MNKEEIEVAAKILAKLPEPQSTGFGTACCELFGRDNAMLIAARAMVIEGGFPEGLLKRMEAYAEVGNLRAMLDAIEE